MPIYKPSELREFLEKLGVHPKKGLSQNFLIDGNILRKIASLADLRPNDTVLEVGPGPGSLTEVLLDGGAHVVAVEKDEVFARELSRLKTPANQLDVYCDDIMEFPLDTILKPLLQDGNKAKVIANLPYHLTTPIIANMVTRRDLFSKLILMVQDEVARRFVAKPGTADYSSFTVFLGFYCKATYGFTVGRKCFYPAPKVDSAVVLLEPVEPPHVSNVDAFFTLTRTAFNQRRKMLRSSLRNIYPHDTIEEALKAIGKKEEARPEELTIDDFIRLFKWLDARNPSVS